MKKVMSLKDGGQIEWKDRETLRYSENGLWVDIWVDFEAGWFSSGRILKSFTIDYWCDFSCEKKQKIDEGKKQEIVDKLINYYKEHGRNVTIEDKEN